MPIYAFVDAPSASPTVIFDLDAQSPFSVVVGTSTQPPTRRVSSSGSSARNGDVVAQAAYNDRLLTIRLRVELNTTAEQQSEGIQTLARLLDGPQWLQWQHEAKIEPVFYRTKYGDFEVEDSILNDTPIRYLTLSITAEPFGYGLPVTGTETINNDPTAATNPMMFAMPDVQGDVAAPLRVDVVYNDIFVNTAVASLAMPSSEPVTAPVWIPASSLTPVAGTGYSWSTVADAAAVGGSVRRYTWNSGTPGATPALTGANLLTGVAPGDYRMFARVSATNLSTFDLSFGFGPAAAESSMIRGWDASVAGVGNGFRNYVDLGVVRLPVGYPLYESGAPSGIPATEVALDMYVTPTHITTDTLDLEGILFVPLDLDVAIDSRYLATTNVMAQFPVTLVVDGAAQQMTPVNALNVLGSLRSFITGDFLAVVPGAQNSLHLVRNFATNDNGQFTTDLKTATIDIEYTYLPQYLYDRPASS